MGIASREPDCLRSIYDPQSYDPHHTHNDESLNLKKELTVVLDLRDRKVDYTYFQTKIVEMTLKVDQSHGDGTIQYNFLL